MPLHPATLLAAWIACALALPWLDGSGLALLSVLLLAGMGDGAVRARVRLLLRRTRLLLIALLAVYGFGTPGTALLPAWPALSPTDEGLLFGGLQAWRLGWMLVSLAWLLTLTGREGMLAAIYTLLRPLAALGLPLERFAVRLGLVLAWAESAPRLKLSPAGLAAAMDRMPAELPPRVTVEIPPATWRDGFCLLCLAGGLGALLW
jgi:energy-coupling factor transporter transmembrane protein EcfT